MDFKQIADRINTQDNRGTAHPLFCVYKMERIYGIDEDYHDGDIQYRSNDSGDEVNFIERPEFMNAHFTEASAQKYIDENAHNLDKPFIYVSSMYRCPEMIAIREWLAVKNGEGGDE